MKIKILFKDEGGNEVRFAWWWRWQIAKWHLKNWMKYEGIPTEGKYWENIKYGKHL